MGDDRKIVVFNVYIPHASAFPNYHPDFVSLLSLSSDDSVYLGDFNAHHSDWYSSLSDARGDLLADSVDGSSLFVLNGDSPTRLPKAANQCPSSPVVTLVPAHVAVSLNWTTHTTLNSDHLPITVSFSDIISPLRSRRTFTNLLKADWAGYIREIKISLSNIPPPVSCAKGKKVFRNILLQASRHNIPSGFRKDFISGLPADAKHLIKQRDELRRLDPCDPDSITEAIWVFKRQKWIEKLESSSYQSNPSKFWPLLKHLSGKGTRPPPNQPISFKNKMFTKAPVVAYNFCKQYSNDIPHKSNPRH
jgi:hypothetical protein